MERQQSTKGTRKCPLPEDFPQRLERLKAASGLGWKALARRLGSDYGRVKAWRRGMEPTGGAMLALCQLAEGVPGGKDAILHGVVDAAGRDE